MAKRQIRVTITDEGEIKIDNAGNPDEQKILAELAELAEFVTGDKAGFKVEKHTHGAHSHTHEVQHIGGKQ